MFDDSKNRRAGENEPVAVVHAHIQGGGFTADAIDPYWLFGATVIAPCNAPQVTVSKIDTVVCGANADIPMATHTAVLTLPAKPLASIGNDVTLLPVVTTY